MCTYNIMHLYYFLFSEEVEFEKLKDLPEDHEDRVKVQAELNKIDEKIAEIR